MTWIGLTLAPIPSAIWRGPSQCKGTGAAQGIVERGAEYERVRDQLIRDFHTLKGPDGLPLIKEIWKKEEVYHGAHLDDAPDILFFPKDLETIAFGDFEFGSNKIVEPAYGVSSSHRMNGILIAGGANIQRTRRLRIRV